MNGLTPSKTGVTDWPPGPPPRAARGTPQPSDAFAGMLDAHQARTATAEGPKRSSEAKERRAAEHRAELARREGVELDELAITMHQRKAGA